MLQITTYSTLLNYCIPTTTNSTKLATYSTLLRNNAPQLSCSRCYSFELSTTFTNRNSLLLYTSDPNRHKVPSSRLQLHTTVFVFHITSANHHLSLTTRPNRHQIINIDSQSALNRLYFATNAPKLPWIAVNVPELRRIVPNRLKLDSRHHRMSHSFFFAPNLLQSSQMVAKWLRIAPKRRLTHKYDITECRNSCSLVSSMPHMPPKIFPTRH